MAAKPSRTLFEAIRASKSEAVRGLDVGVHVPRPDEERVRPVDLGLGVERAGPRRLVVVLVLVAVAIIAGILIIARAGREQFREDHALLPLEEVARGPVRGDVLANSGPASLGTEMYVYDAEAESAGGGAEGGTPGPKVGDGSGKAEGGEWRIRICRSPKSRKKDFDNAAKFLEERDVPTTAEYRKGFYFLYTGRTFASDTHADTLATLERIRQLGKEFSEASGTSTDFRDAYPLKRTSE